MTEPDEIRTLHTPPVDHGGPAYNAVRIRQLLTDGCGTISLYRTTADGGPLEVGRARNCRDHRFDVELLGPVGDRAATVLGTAKFIHGLIWSLWRADGHWVGYASTLAFRDLAHPGRHRCDDHRQLLQGRSRRADVRARRDLSHAEAPILRYVRRLQVHPVRHHDVPEHQHRSAPRRAALQMAAHSSGRSTRPFRRPARHGPLPQGQDGLTC